MARWSEVPDASPGTSPPSGAGDHPCRSAGGWHSGGMWTLSRLSGEFRCDGATLLRIISFSQKSHNAATRLLLLRLPLATFHPLLLSHLMNYSATHTDLRQLQPPRAPPPPKARNVRRERKAQRGSVRCQSGLRMWRWQMIVKGAASSWLRPPPAPPSPPLPTLAESSSI